MFRLTLFQLYFILSLCPESLQLMLLTQIQENVSLGASLGQCIVTVGRRFFDVNKDIIHTRYRRKITFEIPKLEIDLNRNTAWTFYSAEMNFLPNIFHCYDKNYLLQIGNYDDAVIAFEMIKQVNCWNPNQRIYIFSPALFANQTAQFIQLISLTHQQMLSNVVVMLPTKGGQFNFQIYYWTSTDNDKCVKKSKFPHFFSCRFGNVSAFQEEQKDSTACSLAVKAIDYPPYVLYKGKNTLMKSDVTPVKKQLLGGLEIELINLISESLDIDIEYYVSTKEDWGRSFFNGSTTKSMQELTTRKVDLVIGSLTTSLSRYLLFETSVPYAEDYIVCCVAYLGHFDIWSTFLDMYSLHVYITIFLMYVLLTSLVWITAQFNKDELQIYQRGPSVFLYTFASLIGSSVSTLPRTRRVRLFFLMLIIFEFFYVAFYQSWLTSVLSTQKFDQDINTMEDIIKNNMSIYSPQENRRYFEYRRSKIGDFILERWINCNNTTKCLEHVSNSNRVAICVGKSTKDYILQKNQKMGRTPLYCFNHKFISYPVVMIMRKSLPLRERIDEIIGRTISSGLVEKWMSSMFYGKTKESLSVLQALSGILRFSHLKPVFILGAIGFGFASIILLAEKIYHLYK